jgi:hypothetical protein
MTELSEAYAAVDDTWRKAGLYGARVKLDTPVAGSVIAAVWRYATAKGWRWETLMGPVSSDTWGYWVHIFSHCLKSGHNLEHAKAEMELSIVVINALWDEYDG